MNTSRNWTALLWLLGAAACSTPYQPKTRTFEPGPYAPAQQPAHGSLFAAGGRGLLEDHRPSDVGDVIVIRIDEADSASHDTTTALDRESAQNLGVTGALEKLDPDLGLANLFGAQSEYNFNGGGSIQRRGRVNGVLPVRVQRVLPNGDFFVEGTKVVLVGEEERHLYISGVVRPIDVASDGSVASSRVADAEIEYTGRGDATDVQQAGWLTQILQVIWPF